MALFAYDLIGPGTGLCYFAAVAFAVLLVAAVAAVLWFRARVFAAAASVTLGAVLRLFFAFASWPLSPPASWPSPWDSSSA